MTRLLPRIAGLQVSDLRGLAAMAVGTTRDVTAVVEGVHRSVHATLGLPGASRPGRTAGITGLVYRSIGGVTRLTGAGLDTSLALLEPLAQRMGHEPASSREREVLLGVINGILGDRLEASGNPLSIPMTLFHRGEPIRPGAPARVPGVSGRIIVMIHGLCMTEHGWQAENRAGPDLGATLAAHVGGTPVYLRYNSGRAVAANGRDLSEHLEALLARWPVPVEEITLLGHSMGGLITRSALAWGKHRGDTWPGRLRNVIFLGTPHHGAPLERAGAWVDCLLGTTPWTRPFTRLSQGRSRGIQDLREGDGVLGGRPAPGNEARPCPDDLPGHRSADALPESVRVLAVAGTRSEAADLARAGRNIGALAGDGLVPVASALGRHGDAERDLGLTESSCVIVPRTHHMALLHDRAVARSLRTWLSRRSEPEA